MKNKVKKALSPEELTLINNIEAIVSELKQTAGSAENDEAPAPEAEVTMMKGKPIMGDQKPNDEAEKADDSDEDEDVEKAHGEPDGDECEKSIVTAPTKAPAYDDAEALLEDLPETDTKAIAEVNKAREILRKHAARKSGMSAKDAAVVKALQAMSAEIATLKKSLVGIIEGTGLAEQMTANLEVAKSLNSQPAPAPVQSTDMSALIAALQGMAGVQKSQNVIPPREEVRKSLGEAMYAVLGGAENTIRK